MGAALGLGSAFVGALLAAPVLRYVFYPLTAHSDDSDWTEVDTVASLSGATMPLRRELEFKRRDGWREVNTQTVIYIIKTGDKLAALSAICPHLGCTVPWNPGRNEFVCPCHGGTFSPNGTRVSGPPRRSLDSLETKVSGGKLMVKYQTFRPDVSSKVVTT
jgi:menaquinol-cytochrome c reductase iron-sulfur subunit